MNKFITVTGYDDLTYTFNISHIICVLKDNKGAIIKHTPWGENGISTLAVKETYEDVMEMIKS